MWQGVVYFPENVRSCSIMSRLEQSWQSIQHTSVCGMDRHNKPICTPMAFFAAMKHQFYIIVVNCNDWILFRKFSEKVDSSDLNALWHQVSPPTIWYDLHCNRACWKCSFLFFNQSPHICWPLLADLRYGCAVHDSSLCHCIKILSYSSEKNKYTGSRLISYSPYCTYVFDLQYQQ